MKERPYCSQSLAALGLVKVLALDHSYRYVITYSTIVSIYVPLLTFHAEHFFHLLICFLSILFGDLYSALVPIFNWLLIFPFLSFSIYSIGDMLGAFVGLLSATDLAYLPLYFRTMCLKPLQGSILTNSDIADWRGPENLHFYPVPRE